MPKSRPTSNPVSYHKHTNQYYVTRGGRRIYLGCDRDEAIKKYHQLGLGYSPTKATESQVLPVSLKELANRFIAAQRANWRNPESTMRSYKDWIGRFLRDHKGLRVSDFTVESFAAWKISLKNRKYSAKSINHYLSTVRAMFVFAEETGIIDKSPKLKLVKNEKPWSTQRKDVQLYAPDATVKLIRHKPGHSAIGKTRRTAIGTLPEATGKTGPVDPR